ncbi:MAG: S8 family serine peptidase [Nocardioidaceae bacterium]
MRRTLIVTAVAALLLSLLTATAGAMYKPTPWTGKIGPAVETVLAGLAPGEMTTVVLTMREQADPSSIKAPSRRLRVQRIVNDLRSTSKSSQRSIRAVLRTRDAQGQVARTKRLWISNAISVTATARVIRELAVRSDVASVSPDVIPVVPTAGTPEPNVTAVKAPAEWNLGQTGQGVVVANLDSGVDVTHADLAGRWRGGTNSWYDPYGQHPTTPTDLTGHGTATMGVMVGGDAGGTSIGMAPGATWIAAKIFNDSGTATTTAIHQAFQWVLDPDGNPSTNDTPRVVNGSWSIGTGPSCDLTFQPDLQALRAAGILPVFAAGNFGSGASSSVSPANYPEALSVGAISSTNLVYSSSSRGPSTCGGRARVFPDVVAPGVNVYSADRYGNYQTLSGTSMAAPHAAGALALLLGAHPGLTADQQQAALIGTAVDLGVAGPDNSYGNGRIDVQAADASIVSQPDATGPTTSSVTVTPSVTDGADPNGVQLSATADDSSAGGSSIAAAEYFVDNVGADGSGTALTVATAGPVSSLTGSIPASTVSALSDGVHPVWVHSKDAAGNWGSAVSALLTVSRPQLYISTLGNENPPGVSGTADDADIYRWSGGVFTRDYDASAKGLPGVADIDGYDRVSATQFYASFTAASTKLPGLGTVQDEDVVYFDGTNWSMFFDGTAKGLTASAQDLDAISIVGGTLYFSTVGNTAVPGVTGTPDNADIYSWNGSSFARVWDATATGLVGAANVNGFVRVDATHFYLSFISTTTKVPGLGLVDDEDVVYFDGSGWSVYFDGTAHGLGGSSNLDVDAFDIG